MCRKLDDPFSSSSFLYCFTGRRSPYSLKLKCVLIASHLSHSISPFYRSIYYRNLNSKWKSSNRCAKHMCVCAIAIVIVTTIIEADVILFICKIHRNVCGTRYCVAPRVIVWRRAKHDIHINQLRLWVRSGLWMRATFPTQPPIALCSICMHVIGWHGLAVAADDGGRQSSSTR